MSWSPDYADDPAEVFVGIETDRELLVGALIAPRLPGVGDQPAGGLPLPRPARHLAGQVRQA
jgi:hypothetical protein